MVVRRMKKLRKEHAQRLLSCEKHDIIKKERGEWVNSVFKRKSQHSVRRKSTDFQIQESMGKSSDCRLSAVANH